MNKREVKKMNANDKAVLTSDFPVEGMSCAACAASVESILEQVEGVEDVQVNFAANSVHIDYSKSVDPAELKAALQDVGYDLIIDQRDTEELEQIRSNAYNAILKRTVWSALLALPVFVIGMFFKDWQPGKWISLLLSIPVIGIFGRHFFIRAWKQAKHRSANMDTLVALSTGIAFLFSVFNTLSPKFWTSRGIEPHVYYEAVVIIITFILLGKLLEERAKSQTTTALKKLINLQPTTVQVVEKDHVVEKPLESVILGNEILVRPGERIPVDGKIILGNGIVDESMISGESIPVDKQINDVVYAGTVNKQGSFRLTATSVGSDTILSQIIKRVQQAQNSKAPVQRLADRIAGIFVPVVLGIALVTFVVWMIFGGEQAFTHALLTSITVLVIACPCALGLATPTAIMVGVGKGAENNILIRDAEGLELAHKVNAVVLDKTGTVTSGKPRVQKVIWDSDVDVDLASSILLGLEQQSEHPLAQAVVRHFKELGIIAQHLVAFESQTGRGVKAETESGETYFAGNLQFIKSEIGAVESEFIQLSDDPDFQAHTVVYFANKEKVLAILFIFDSIKETSKRAIETLRNRDIDVYLCSGDNKETVAAVAQQIDVSAYYGNMMPSDKRSFIEDLKRQGKVVAMVGDGINDAEALAAADVGIAMGHGSDIALDVATITLITSDLDYVSKALKLSSKTVGGIRQNLFWAFIYNLIGIPIAAGILFPVNGFLLNPMIAGAAMAFSSVSVVANSLRLKRIKL